MRVVWLDLGHRPDFQELQKIGATGVAFDIRDTINRSYLQSLRDMGLDPYVYSVDGWFPGMDGRQFAEWTSARLEEIAPRTGNAIPAVCLDIERHDHIFVRDCLKRWRQLRPSRITDWTLESFQFGWEDAAGFHKGWAAELANDIETYNVRVAPQFYYGPGPLGPDMTPCDPAEAILNAVKGGVNPHRLIGCYDAARVVGVDRWRGYAFTQGRIP